ncbi:uncharacterized protein MONBRDRAFT_12480 [Monosiga brevicollis MX1]|uniref:Ankyrin repeat protein n=1 Tax=Monosiga brevicollis TaxID=81824 RepID=A9VCE3_MONBE|nr:uncharacterized protein MONBRDRAFT_12480 [Monosiga brevicollis MX1]EDQ84770.1 predicted protein [Monosiga brevicollis MX1]|eukprot:XP_001750420.1 hypothetical protein [Monosiga brevicollis MX1]
MFRPRIKCLIPMHRFTPLHNACDKGLVEVVEILLKHGVDADAKTAIDRTPLHIACSYTTEGPVAVLLEHGANVDARDEKTFVALVRAVILTEQKKHSFGSVAVLFAAGWRMEPKAFDERAFDDLRSIIRKLRA